MDQYLYSLVIALLTGSVVSVLIWIQNKKERNGGFPFEERSRYPALIPPFYLPIYACALLVVLPLVSKEPDFVSRLFLEIFSIFLHISVYHGVLLLMMPVLRKKISARVCALLWTIPTLFYVVLYSYFKGAFQPWLVIPLPMLSYGWLCAIWLWGFAVVMLWKVVSHLRFRKWVLASAEPVTDPMVLRLWEEEQMVAQVWKGYRTERFRIPLVQSECITTPLTIGLWRGSLYMVLPRRSYTENDYRWIFRHELVHIGREDSGNKFLLAFCTAMCWFNPLMWLAMKQCASDLERSCDETVLLNADSETKKQYAYLLLKTAGDDRGFTTCLSASGASMRYRLESAMSTSKRYTGSIVAGLLTFILFFGYGTVTVAYDSLTASEAIYQDEGPSALLWVETERDRHTFEDHRAAKALYQYFDDQRVLRLTNEYDMDQVRWEIRYDSNRRVTLTDRMMDVYDYTESRKTQYFFEEPLDWSHLYALLESDQ